MTSEYMHTIVIGPDGREWDVIKPIIKKGDLANLVQLR